MLRHRFREVNIELEYQQSVSADSISSQKAPVSHRVSLPGAVMVVKLDG